MFHAKHFFFKLVQHQGVIHVGNILDINLNSDRNWQFQPRAHEVRLEGESEVEVSIVSFNDMVANWVK